VQTSSLRYLQLRVSWWIVGCQTTASTIHEPTRNITNFVFSAKTLPRKPGICFPKIAFRVRLLTRDYRKSAPGFDLGLFSLNLTVCISVVILACARMLSAQTPASQEFLPSPPTDHALVYILDQQNKLLPLPFEKGQTPLHLQQVAKDSRTSYIELRGEHSPSILAPNARWFLFTYQRPGAHPPFLVLLTPHHGARRVTAIAQQGLSGFAISSDEIIKPSLRVLTLMGGDLVFMELHPRVSLMPGEYAIIGDDLEHIATFRVIANVER
jgi:hypothetical protein